MTAYAYLCINYHSSPVLENSLRQWKKYIENVKIYVVDCYHSDGEASEVRRIAALHGAEALYLPNDGYGAALNAGLELVLSKEQHDGGVLFFGNCDVVPTHKIQSSDSLPNFPMPVIYTGEKKENPLLTKAQERFLFISELSAKIDSKAIFYVWVILKKLIAACVPHSAAVAVHGSLFCAKLSILKRIHPIFDGEAFLYCEELFFMDKIKSVGELPQHVDLQFRHEGSVSTGRYVKKSFNSFFKVWRQSMRIYSATKKA
jgi:glycosyltransferase involved in cell wall biosynthesis